MFALLAAFLLSAPQSTEPTRVSIPTADGQQIVAHFFDAGPGAPATIMFPMCAPGLMEGWHPLARRLQAQRISTLAVTYRGWGGSTGQQPPPRTTLADAQRFWTTVWGPDADSAVAYLQKQLGARTPLAVIGTSCGVHMSLLTASRHPDVVRAAILMAGPHTDEQVDYIKRTPSLAIMAASSEGDGQAPEWAKALRAASSHPNSTLVLVPGNAHGTPLLTSDPTIVDTMTTWLAAQLRPNSK